ncbi:probable enhancer of mRNA-decapping protein 4 [Coccomyxa sp. Obi]|nr:probable enhancer of mRNA-decapping protein 4 [Coccomyxa sp. Obi]
MSSSGGPQSHQGQGEVPKNGVETDTSESGRGLASPAPKENIAKDLFTESKSLESRRTSGAVDAIEAALSAGTQAGARAAKEPQGRSLPEDPDIVYNVDTDEEGEAQPQLEVMPITVYHSDFVLEMRRQIAVNNSYICYALKQGHLRVLSTQSALRALVKAHAPPLTDLQFHSAGVDLLASADKEGHVAVWRLVHEAEEGIKAERVLFLTLGDMQGEGQELHLAWHPQSDNILAVTVKDGLLLIDVEAAREGGGTDVACNQSDLQNGLRLLEMTAGSSLSSTVAFSPDGHLLAAAAFDGKVHVWDISSLSQSLPVSTMEPFEDRALGSITWVSPIAGGAPWLLAGDAVNRELRLLQGDVTSGFHTRQALRLESLEGEQAFYNHLVYHAASNLVVLANSRRNAVYTVHLGRGKECGLRFDYLAKFSVGYPILSVTAAQSARNGQEAVQLFCVQTQAIQQYSLHPQMCRAAADTALSAKEPEYSAASAHAGVSGPAQHPHSSEADNSHEDDAVDSRHVSAPAGPPTEMPSSPPSIGASAPAFSAGSPSAMTPVPAEGQSSSLPLPLPPPVTTPPAAAVPQPRLLTPKQLIKLAGSRPASQGSSASADLHSLRASDSLGAPQPPASAGMRSPQTPFSVYGTPPAAPTLAPPGPALSKSPSPAVEPAAVQNHAPAAAEGGDVGTSQASLNGMHQGPARILKRRKEGEDAEEAADVAAPEASAQKEAGAEPVPEAPAPAAGKKAPEAPAKGPSQALSKSVATEGNGMGTEALLSRMEGMQKKLLTQLTASQANTLKSLREDMRKETKRIEAATQAQVNRLVQKQAELIEAERTALVAEQHKDLEKLIAAISASVNRDLPLRIEEMMRRELTNMSNTLTGSLAGSMAGSLPSLVGPACHAALAEALPRELAGPQLQGALEKALTAQLRAALPKPLQDSFRTTFQSTLIPAFEGACQTMFSQVQATFAGGLAEHLQAAGGANAAVVASLKESVGRVGAAADTLSSQVSEGQRRLVQLAEEAAAAGGARPRLQALTVSQIEARVEDPTIALKKLLQENKYEEAFGRVLDMADVSRVTWLCQQLDATQLLSQEPLPLSQSVLLSLMQQLGSDLSKDTGIKLQWLKEAAPVLDPNDTMLAPHMRQILQQLFAALQACQPLVSPGDARACRTVIHLVNSLLHQCH